MKRVGVAAGLVVAARAAVASAQVPPPGPTTIALGDWQLTPVLEARVRGEYRHDLDGVDRGWIGERTRLGVDAQQTNLEARVVLQDARVWSATPALDETWEAPALGFGPGAQALTAPSEAWAEARTSAPRPAFVRVGRQAVTWGEGRLLGAADESPAGRWLDAIRGRLPVGDGALELLGASLSDPAAPTSAYGELLGARVEWAYHPLFAVEGYALARWVDVPVTLDPSLKGQTYTGAFRLHGDAYAWTWGVEGAYQLGHADDVGPGEDRAAWAAAAHVAHTFERVALLPTVRLGASYASGDDGGTTDHAFDPMLPDVRLWHGAMDLFGWSNEEEASARVAVAPWADGVAAIEYRYARLAQPGGAWRTDYGLEVGAARGNAQGELGHEIDAALEWSPWAAVGLAAGYSIFVLGDGARAVLAASAPGPAPAVSQYAYLETTIRVP